MSFAVILLLALLVFTSSLSFVSLVLAQDEDLPVTSGFEPIYEVFRTVGYAAPIALIMGLVNCLLGYLKSTPPESFDLTHFIFTALISLIIGIATIYGGWSYVNVEEWLANGSLTLYLYWIAKVIAKKLNWVVLQAKETGPGPPSPAA